MSHLHFWLLLELVILTNVAFAGAALFYWAKPMSRRYNEWTMRFQERHPQISKPPSAETASLHYRIMVVFFRAAGGFLFAEAVYLFLRALGRIPR